MKPGLLPMMLLRDMYANVSFLPSVFPVGKTVTKLGPDDTTFAAIGPGSKTIAKVGPSSVTIGVP